uniref:Ras GTPase-activating protein 3-like n=1 Tax=Dermatophagoides pteronyssinus TaxID=6956 RepID=A0A6P6XV29_DERPT|nr:ras GTPase-activating protein 3-like [Dermatophagoides pteronyssinus]
MEQSFIQTTTTTTDAQPQHSMNVRLVQQVKIRIGEAKNLQPKNGTNSIKDCYCVIRLDSEEIFRTHNSIDKTLDPFFGEEFHFDIPRIFHYLSIYVYEREKSSVHHHQSSNRNRSLGKVILRNDQLKNFNTWEELWFPLIPVNFTPEIKGVLHLQIEPNYIMNNNSLNFFITIFECQNIIDFDHHNHNNHNQNNSSNSYYCLINLRIFDESYVKKSKIKRKTTTTTTTTTANNSHYNETFSFEQPQLSSTSLSSSSSVSSSTNNNNNSSYSSNSNSNNQQQNYDYNLGSLRLRINYISDYVFPNPFYDSLCNLLLSSIEIKPITSSVAYLLGEFVLNKADAAQPLVKIFLHYKKIVTLIKYLAEDEISKVSDVNTIFRGNSLVSKCIDELMKLVGIRYLHETLRSSIDLVIQENKICEIDPIKINNQEYLRINMRHLKTYTDLFFNSIIESMDKCPQIMCDIFAVLKELAIKFFPDNKDVCYYVISGFVFLRFFAPSILNPRLFELTDKKINSQVNRTFTLISKTIQSIGNLVVSKKNTPLIKENYMTLFYKEFITDIHVSKTKEFLESISSSCRLSTKDYHEPVILKESIMFKKSNGGYKRIGFGTSYKKRYFCITTQHFFYAKAKNKSPLFKFPISEITVKKLPDNYSMKNMFQVIHNKCTLNIQASNCVQEREWLDTLNRLIQFNQSSSPSSSSTTNLNKYDDHRDDTTTTTTNNNNNNNNNNNHLNRQQQQQLSFDLTIQLDPDRELARIYSLFQSNIESIRTILRNLKQKNYKIVKFWKGNCRNYPQSQFIIEHRQTLITTLSLLNDCIGNIEQKYRQYLTSIIGSELLPIENFG